MKVLWITNTIFPEAQKLLTGSDEFKESGGWLIGASEQLAVKEEVSLAVVAMSKNVETVKYLQGKTILHILVPYHKNPLISGMQSVWNEVRGYFRPDIVHIHGTEHPFALSYLRFCGSKNVVVSIQGLISEISKFYLAQIKVKDIFLNFTLRDILCGSMLKEKNNFIKRGNLEIEYLCSTKHVIGRTTFDKDHALRINSQLQYHFCNETLRSEFYSGKWMYNKCKKHTIFLSQASYPIKGLHVFLKALPYVIAKYPDTKVYIAGFDITCRNGSLRRKLLIPGYGLYIKRIIEKYKLDDAVNFTGALNASEMKEQLLQANVFVSPSSIENSSNSLGEAQLLGVPCIASYVGGIPDMIPNSSCGLLYRFEDFIMLASRIMDVFENTDNFDNTEMITMARKRHNQDSNVKQLLDIYKSLLLI